MSFGNFIKFIKLVNELRKKNVINLSSQFGFLDTVESFVTVKGTGQTKDLILSRTFESSANLLSCLIGKYKLTKSEVTLNQIMEVIKEEIIKRGV